MVDRARQVWGREPSQDMGLRVRVGRERCGGQEGPRCLCLRDYGCVIGDLGRSRGGQLPQAKQRYLQRRRQRHRDRGICGVSGRDSETDTARGRDGGAVSHPGVGGNGPEEKH
eukprot:1749073-Prorocentrum_lima.AAC.1